MKLAIELTEQQAQHIVVRCQEQICGIAQRLIIGKPGRVCVPMRADDREFLDRFIQVAGYGAFAGFAGQQSVWQKKCV